MESDLPPYVIELAQAEAELRGLLAAKAFWAMAQTMGGVDQARVSQAFAQIVAERRRIVANMEHALACLRRN